jgi:hypothetical protein
MPRTSVWFNPQQLEEVHKVFGGEVNLSGVVRAGLGLLLDAADSERKPHTRRAVEMLSEMEEAMEIAERVVGRNGRERIERGAKR